MIYLSSGNYSNIQAIGRKEYQFSSIQSKPYLKTKRALNLPNVYFDDDFTSKISQQIASDSLTLKIKENFENIGYVPKVSRIISVQKNVAIKRPFERIQEVKEEARTPVKKFKKDIETPFYSIKQETPTPQVKLKKSKSDSSIKKGKIIAPQVITRTVGVQDDLFDIKKGRPQKAKKNNPFNIADMNTQTD